MNESPMAALHAALKDDEALQARFAEARTDAEIVAVAREAGVVLEIEDVEGSAELSDVELEQVGGGYTFPPTDWIYCDNPWTNVYCTAKC